ncbi:MAG: hypothetical protein ACR65W_16280 [Methylocystis sp.]|uniref:hypothetical protein n=1 Tax=Methylocystis sp. TaxID=1911079 RepID=UPI003DA4A45E
MPIMKIVKAHTPEAVVIAISVFSIALIWLLSAVHTMNATLTAVDVKTAGTNQRVDDTNLRIDRIAAVLPDVRIKIAHEEISKPIQAAIVVTEPSEISAGNWVTAIHLLETAKQKRRTYFVPVKGPNDNTAAYLASGAAVSLDSDSISFETLSSLSADAGEPTFAPTFVISRNSMALRKLSPEFEKALEKALTNFEPALNAKNATLRSKTTSWDTLSAELTENAESYEVPRN